MTKIRIQKSNIGQRLDVFLTAKLTDLSRASIQKLLREGMITVNQQSQKAGYILKASDKIDVETSITTTTKIPDISLPVMYEDDDCIVIDKPTGLLTHSKGAFNPEATIATFIQQKSKNVDGERSGIVHRLDRATSGVMICAKTPEALSWLQKQFSQRKVKKMYNAVISGNMNPSEAIIDMPIERNPQKPQTFRVGSNGKTAQTYYRVVREGVQRELLELKPETGRTHQLRVHLSHQHHPIIGDTLYGGEKADRLYLHATKLEITLPNRSRMIFESPLPKSFLEMVK